MSARQPPGPNRTREAVPVNAPQKRADKLEAGDVVECDDGWAVVRYVYLPPSGPHCLIHFEGGTSTAERRALLVPTRGANP